MKLIDLKKMLRCRTLFQIFKKKDNKWCFEYLAFSNLVPDEDLEMTVEKFDTEIFGKHATLRIFLREEK